MSLASSATGHSMADFVSSSPEPRGWIQWIECSPLCTGSGIIIVPMKPDNKPEGLLKLTFTLRDIVFQLRESGQYPDLHKASNVCDRFPEEGIETRSQEWAPSNPDEECVEVLSKYALEALVTSLKRAIAAGRALGLSEWDLEHLSARAREEIENKDACLRWQMWRYVGEKVADDQRPSLAS